jgi:PAS domain S-box-containing protein
VGEARELVKRALAGETIVGEFGRLRREGKIEYHSFNIQPVKHCTGIVGIEGFINDITERKRAEEALRASEEKHRTLFETMAQGVVYQNAEGHIISANPAAERLLGLTLAQMLGRTSMDPRWQAIHEDGSDFPGDTHPCMIALKTGKEVSHVVMGVFHPGANEYVWINIHAVPQFRPGETKPYQVYTTFDDITGRKRAEEALRRSRENFEALAESASEGILIATGEEGRNVYANRRAVEITGYPIEELLKTCMRDLAHPEELPKIAERYKERLEGLEVPNHYETAFLNKDGVKVPIEISPSRTIWQNQLADMVMFRDITERKRAEEAVRRASAYNRSLIEASLDPLVTIAPDGKITDVNNATEKATGLPRQQLIGTDFSDYFTDPEKARAGYEQVFREGLVQDYELEIRHRDGHATPVLYKASVYRGETGDVIGVFAAARDITARKRTEEALRQLSGRLLRSQDEERRRIARQLHETTAQGLAGLAVNLTIVKSSAADLSPRASACLSESLELAEQCSREIRTLSYLLHPPLVDEAGLAPALRWYTAGFAQRSGIEVHVDVSPEFDRLPSELELTLYRIVQEALTNIHRHSGSKTARICLERRPNEIVLTVADEGHGFPSAALEIAGPESVDVGVGIPGMRERLRQLGGRLHIQSGSRGTTLTAILPLGQVTNGQTTLPFGG